MVELSIINSLDYRRQLSAETSGKPTQIYFKRYPTPQVYFPTFPDSSTKYVVELVLLSYRNDMDEGGDNPDLLKEEILSLISELSLQLAPSSGASSTKFRQIDYINNKNTEKAEKDNDDFDTIELVF